MFLSPVAADTLTTSFEEIGNNRMELPQHDPLGFFYLHQWMNTGELNVLNHCLSSAPSLTPIVEPDMAHEAHVEDATMKESEGYLTDYSASRTPGRQGDTNAITSASALPVVGEHNDQKTIASTLCTTTTTLCRLYHLVTSLAITRWDIQSTILTELRDVMGRARDYGFVTPLTPLAVTETLGAILEGSADDDDLGANDLWTLVKEEMCVAFTNKPSPQWAEWEGAFEASPSFKVAVVGAMMDRISNVQMAWEKEDDDEAIEAAEPIQFTWLD